MANICENRIHILFKNNQDRDYFLKENNLQGSDKVDEYNEDFNHIYYTKKHHKSCVIFYDTRWSPLEDIKLIELFDKYKVYKMLVNYMESGEGFAGTQYIHRETNGEVVVLENEDDYTTIDTECYGFNVFRTLVEKTLKRDDLENTILKKFYTDFLDCDYIYLSINKQAYKHFAPDGFFTIKSFLQRCLEKYKEEVYGIICVEDAQYDLDGMCSEDTCVNCKYLTCQNTEEDEEFGYEYISGGKCSYFDIFVDWDNTCNEFTNYSNDEASYEPELRVFCLFDEEVFYSPKTESFSIWGEVVRNAYDTNFDDLRVSGWLKLMVKNPSLDQDFLINACKQINNIKKVINYDLVENFTEFETEYLRDGVKTIIKGLDDFGNFKSEEGLEELICGVLDL
jgi:hypothetical protein